ncbi:SIR2 family protein [Enterococcus casseliflavus]|uniref:SIR2 family protein n=1 Tax=Enterococcus casseliflavus TaxID=37734 RepID=UPI003798A7CD
MLLAKLSKLSTLYDTCKKDKNESTFYDLLNVFCMTEQKLRYEYYLEMLDNNINDPEFFFSEMKNENIFFIDYQYKCEEETEITNILDSYCECGKKVSQHDSVIELYQLSSDFKEFISDRNKKALDYNGTSWRKNKLILEELRGVNNLVPFLGSGLSKPLGFPSWPELVEEYKEGCSESELLGIQFFLSKKKYLDCFDLIINDVENQNIKNVEQLKQKISRAFKSKKIDNDNNYKDVINLNLPLIITTNYDDNIDISGENRYSSVIFKDIEDIRSIENDNVIIHLHGSAKNTVKSSMIVTKQDYIELYEDDIYMRKLQSILGNKAILFIGYSLDDYYFMDELIKICEANKGFSEYYAFMINVSQADLQSYMPDYYNIIKIISIDISETVEFNCEVINIVRSYLKYINNNLYLMDI